MNKRRTFLVSGLASVAGGDILASRTLISQGKEATKHEINSYIRTFSRISLISTL